MTKDTPRDLQNRLREYADIADAGDKPHWAKAMREAATDLDWHAQEAMRRNGCTFDELHVCGGCEGTGYTA